MKNQAKPFLKNAIILTAATVLIAVCMREWGVAQILIVALVALLAGAQWALWAYMRKTK